MGCINHSQMGGLLLLYPHYTDIHEQEWDSNLALSAILTNYGDILWWIYTEKNHGQFQSGCILVVRIPI